MARGMMETIVPSAAAIGAERCGQRLAVDAKAAVALTRAGQLDAGRFAHHVHHIQWTAGLNCDGVAHVTAASCAIIVCWRSWVDAGGEIVRCFVGGISWFDVHTQENTERESATWEPHRCVVWCYEKS